MRNKFLQFIYGLMVLVIAGAAEELFPKFMNVGFPFLIIAVAVLAVRRASLFAYVFALVACLMEDSLSHLPLLTSVGFGLALSLIVRRFNLPRSFGLLIYPLYELWLVMWIPSLLGQVFLRALIALPIGGVTLLVLGRLLPWIERKIALDDAE